MYVNIFRFNLLPEITNILINITHHFVANFKPVVEILTDFIKINSVIE